MNIVTREKAKAEGMTKYFTGKPCKFGHLSERYTSNTRCITCAREYINSKEYKDKKSQYNKTYKINNKDKIREYQKKYRKEYFEQMDDEKKNSHRQKRMEYYYRVEADRRKIRTLTTEQLEKKREYNRKWRKKDWERYKSEPDYRCNKLIRNILQRTLEASKQGKHSSTHEVLGYTAKEFKKHIEKQFKKGMNWKNHGEWHVDHIYPISKLIEEGITDPQIINALTNLQPIWKYENLSKHNRITNLL